MKPCSRCSRQEEDLVQSILNPIHFICMRCQLSENEKIRIDDLERKKKEVKESPLEKFIDDGNRRVKQRDHDNLGSDEHDVQRCDVQSGALSGTFEISEGIADEKSGATRVSEVGQERAGTTEARPKDRSTYRGIDEFLAESKHRDLQRKCEDAFGLEEEEGQDDEKGLERKSEEIDRQDSEPRRRVGGTDLIYERVGAMGGEAYVDERSKSVHPFYTIHSYAGKVREKLADWLVFNFSNKGDTVLDPFCGSGSISIACKLHGRIPIGMDILEVPVYATAAAINTPSKRSVSEALRLIRLDEYSKEYDKISDSDYPPSIRRWFEGKSFRGLMALRKIIGFMNSSRLRTFFLAALSKMTERYSRSFGGYHWWGDEGRFRDRSKWDQDPLEFLEDHLKQLMKTPNELWDTHFDVHLGNCKYHIPLETGSTDRIVTDAPYGEMIGYAQNVWVQEWMVGREDIVEFDEDITKAQIPSGVKRLNKEMIYKVTTFWGDMKKMMIESFRVLKSDGTLTIIMGDFKRGTGKDEYLNVGVELQKIAWEIGFTDVSTITKLFDRPGALMMTKSDKTKRLERIVVMRKPTKGNDIIEERVIEEDKIKQGLERFF